MQETVTVACRAPEAEPFGRADKETGAHLRPGHLTSILPTLHPRGQKLSGDNKEGVFFRGSGGGGVGIFFFIPKHQIFGEHQLGAALLYFHGTVSDGAVFPTQVFAAAVFDRRPQ